MNKLQTLLVVLLALFLSSCPCSADQKTDVINLNNAGVKALNDGHFPLAIDKLKEALKLDPSYNLPKDNLVIAHNLYGEALRKAHKPGEALKQFHEAAYLTGKWGMTENYITLESIDDLIKGN